MSHLVLVRTTSGPAGVGGTLMVEDGSTLATSQWSTVERPWLDNAANRSCIPAGDYEVVRRHYGRYFETYQKRWDHKFALEVVHPGQDDCGVRSAILIHTGNNPMADSQGCILVGKARYWIGDRQPCVSRSRDAYCELYDALAPLLFAGGQNDNPLRPAVKLTIVNEWEQPVDTIDRTPGEDAEDVGDRSYL